MNLADVIEGLVEERGLDKDKVIEIVSDGIRAAYEKKYPEIPFVVSFNRKSGSLDIFVNKKVVHTVTDDDTEVSLRRAKTIDASAAIDGEVLVPFEEPVGRIEILTAKQIIASKIKDLEQLAVFNDYKDKKDTIVTGVVHKRERAGYAVKVGDVLALLPQDNTIPGETVRVSHPIRALLQEVYPVAKGDYQLILDRASAEFVKKLLEIEIPEVFEGLVEIKKIVRIPGYKTKAIVASTRKEIDPVGTCVGIGGARIKPILRELGMEKIDLIQATESVENLVRSSLKPAEIDKVDVLDDKRVVVWLASDQRSYAIGKMGQNINLAARLVDMDIQLQDVAPQQDLSFYAEQEAASQSEKDQESVDSVLPDQESSED